MGIIRLLLAFAVLNGHFPIVEDIPLVDGHEAVLTFFAISGFYMALVLDRSYPTPRAFYLSRFITLYPMYVFALLVSLALLTTLDVHPMTNRAAMRGLLADPVAFLVMAWTSTCVFGQELIFSLAPSPGGGLHWITASSTSALWRHAPLIQGWSLSLEIAFYAIAPFLVRLRTRTLIGLVAASLALKLGVMASPWAHMVFFKRCFPLEFWLFGAGILAYRVHRRLPREASPVDYVLFLVLAGLILVAGGVSPDLRPFFLPCATLLQLPLVFRGFKRVGFDRFMGKVSYPFYLLHFSIIALFETYADDPEGWQILLTVLAAALGVHFLFNSGIESLKTKLRRPVASAPVGGAVPQPLLQPATGVYAERIHRGLP